MAVTKPANGSHAWLALAFATAQQNCDSASDRKELSPKVGRHEVVSLLPRLAPTGWPAFAAWLYLLAAREGEEVVIKWYHSTEDHERVCGIPFPKSDLVAGSEPMREPDRHCHRT